MVQTQDPTTSHTAKRLQLKWLVFGVLFALIGLWVGIGATLLYQSAQTGEITQRTSPGNDGNALVSPDETTISSVVDKVSPSVVSVITEVESDSQLRGGLQRLQTGAGSGIIVGKDGYVLTNKHVVDNARDIQLVTSDGTTYDDVSLLGTDPLNDLAFLKIKGVDNLPVAELGDSTTVKIGQRVIAIGNSLGQYQNTVTSGIISGTGRPISAQAGDEVENLTDLLQTDAAINPGNSGGPLLNSSGQVIGINTAIAEDAEGIGFAIPVNAAKGILKQVLAGQPVKRAYLGVRYVEVNAAVAKEYKLDVKQGAYVFNQGREPAVVSGSPASKAGIKKGDVITKINDVEVGPRGGVASLIAEYAPGDRIELTVNRDGKTIVLQVTLTSF